MNKLDVVRYVSQKTNFTQENSALAVNAVYDALREALCSDSKLIITGVGTFTLVERAPRAGRNPITGEPISIPAKKAIKFKAAPNVVKAINDK